MTMVKHNQLNTLLMEILIVVLFFSLCSTVILDVFVGAHNQRARAGAQADALTAAQSLADRLYAADEREDVLRQSGFFERGDGTWHLSCGAYDLLVTLGEETYSAGTLETADDLHPAFRALCARGGGTVNQREYRIGPGAASLMMLVVVLSMSVLGMLALMSARSDENLSLRSAEVARQVAELNVSAERSLAELDDALAKAAGAAQSEDDYLARVEAALNEAMTLEGRTVSWKETNDEGRTLACAVELEPFGAFPRFVRTVYHLAIDEGAMEGEDLLFDAGYIGEL